MKVKGINACYDVEIKNFRMGDGKEGIVITLGNLMTGMMSVVISKEDWIKLKEV